MTEQTAPREEPRADATAAEPELAKNSLSSPQVAIFAIAAAAPAATVALVMPTLAGLAGKALVLAFLATAVLVIMLTNTLAEFSRRIPSAGSLLAWNSEGLGPSVGFVFGWFFVGGYLLIASTGFAAFGAFAANLVLEQTDADIPWWLFSAACVVYVGVLAWRGVGQTLRSAVTLLGIEVSVIVLLCVSLLVTGRVELQSAPFDFGEAPSGWTAFGLAITISMLSVIGYEEAATMSEEAQDPKRSVPRALWVAGPGLLLFFAVVGYILITSYGSAADFAADPLAAETMATDMWGRAGMAISIVVILSCLAFTQTSFNAAVRVLFALGRAKLLPPRLADVHRIHQTPTAAIGAFALVAVPLTFICAAKAGPLDVYAYFGFMTSVAFLVMYAVTNVGLIGYMLRHRDQLNPVRHVLLPILALAGVLYPLYRNVHPLPPSPFPALLGVVAGWALVGILILLYVRRSGKVHLEDINAALEGK